MEIDSFYTDAILDWSRFYVYILVDVSIIPSLDSNTYLEDQRRRIYSIAPATYFLYNT